MNLVPGKAKRLKKAKEEAQDEIERYRQDREKQFREFEAKVKLFVQSYCWISPRRVTCANNRY